MSGWRWFLACALALVAPPLARAELSCAEMPPDLDTLLAWRTAGLVAEDVAEAVQTLLASPLDINRASRRALLALPEVDGALADAVMVGRPYVSVDALLRSGRLPSALNSCLRPLLQVGSVAPARAQLHSRAGVGWHPNSALGASMQAVGRWRCWRAGVGADLETAADAAKPGPRRLGQLGDLHVDGRSGPAQLIVGSFTGGFASRLTFNTSAHPAPDGFYGKAMAVYPGLPFNTRPPRLLWGVAAQAMPAFGAVSSNQHLMGTAFVGFDAHPVGGRILAGGRVGYRRGECHEVSLVGYRTLNDGAERAPQAVGAVLRSGWRGLALSMEHTRQTTGAYATQVAVEAALALAAVTQVQVALQQQQSNFHNPYGRRRGPHDGVEVALMWRRRQRSGRLSAKQTCTLPPVGEQEGGHTTRGRRSVGVRRRTLTHRLRHHMATLGPWFGTATVEQRSAGSSVIALRLQSSALLQPRGGPLSLSLSAGTRMPLWRSGGLARPSVGWGADALHSRLAAHLRLHLRHGPILSGGGAVQLRGGTYLSRFYMLVAVLWQPPDGGLVWGLRAGFGRNRRGGRATPTAQVWLQAQT